MNKPQTNWKKYGYTFAITAVIFATAIFLNNYFNNKKLNQIKNIESRIAIDILSSETQFSLLSELSCKEIGTSFFSKELSELGEKLDYMEQNRSSNNEELLNLKRYYSLLQIKDYLLLQKVKEKCGNQDTPSIIYIYSNKGDCPDCEREGFVLTRLRQDYPMLRIYSFDYNLDLSALRTLVSIYDIKNKTPVLLINDKVYYGFKSIDDIKNIMPEIKKLDEEKAKLELLKQKEATSTKDSE